MRKLFIAILILFKASVFAQNPVVITNPYLFQRYITIHDSINKINAGLDTMASRRYAREVLGTGKFIKNQTIIKQSGGLYTSSGHLANLVVDSVTNLNGSVILANNKRFEGVDHLGGSVGLFFVGASDEIQLAYNNQRVQFGTGQIALRESLTFGYTQDILIKGTGRWRGLGTATSIPATIMGRDTDGTMVSFSSSLVGGGTTNNPLTLGYGHVNTGNFDGSAPVNAKIDTGLIETVANFFPKGDIRYEKIGNYITALTGDGTASGPGSAALTLATVNSNVGSFGSSTAIPTITFDAKGRATAVSTNAVIAPANTLTGSTLAAGVTASSLTSVGTIGIGVWQGTAIANAYLANSAMTLNGISTSLGGSFTVTKSNTDTTSTGFATRSLINNYLTKLLASTTYVPYTGATSNINIGTHSLTGDNIVLNPAGTGAVLGLNISAAPGTGSLNWVQMNIYNTTASTAKTAINMGSSTKTWTLMTDETGANVQSFHLYNSATSSDAFNVNSANKITFYNDLVSSNGNFNYTASNNRLGLGTAGAAGAVLDVRGSSATGDLQVINSNTSNSISVGSFLAPSATGDVYYSVGKALSTGSAALTGWNASGAFLTTYGRSSTDFQVSTTGSIRMGAYGTGISHYSSTGVVTSGPVNLANADVTGNLPAINRTDIIQTSTDASITIAAGGTFAFLIPITAAHDVIMPSATTYSGTTITIDNTNTSGTFVWTFGGATVKDAGGNTLGALVNGSSYILKAYGTGNYWIKVN